MHLRPATPSDLPRLAALYAAAFANDGLFTNFLFPHKCAPERYARESYIHWYQETRQFLYKPQVAIVVAETDADDGVAGEIAGAAVWEKFGTPEPELTKTGVIWVLRRAYARIADALYNLFHSWHAKDPEAFEKLERTVDKVLEQCFSGKYAEHWHCARLGSAEEWRGRGVGRMLCNWGLDKARAKGITAGLEASKKGLRMYKRLGMVQVGPVVGEMTFHDVLRICFIPGQEEIGEYQEE